MSEIELVPWTATTSARRPWKAQQAAAAKGHYGGRPQVFDEDMLPFAYALRANGTPGPEIAKKLKIATSKNTSVASVYRGFAESSESPAS